MTEESIFLMMKQIEFFCDANKGFHEQYYANQSGSRIPVF